MGTMIVICLYNIGGSFIFDNKLMSTLLLGKALEPKGAQTLFGHDR